MIPENTFDNTQVAFALKSDSELERAYFLFKMISKEPLVRIGTAATNFALKANLPIEGLIRATVFDHFCGGVTEVDCVTAIDKMYSKGVSSVLDYSVEGKETEAFFDDAMQKILDIIYFADEKEAIPIVVFKPTGFGRFALFQKIGENQTLTADEKEEWNRIVNRFDQVCKLAKEKRVEVLIDGEESWMQDAADDLVEQMMARYNKEEVVVYNTLQTYRWDRLEFLKASYKRAVEKKFKMGFKIVRGAYMEKERTRASENGYRSPICKTKQVTDDNFNACLEYILNNIQII